MNILLFIASAVGFVAAELLIAIVIAKWLAWGAELFPLDELDDC